MTDLGHVLGSVLASLARARHIADLQTAEIAEQYRDNPLLEGLSVPRVRVPELRIELPILIDGETDGSPGKLHDAEYIARRAVATIHEGLNAYDLRLHANVRQQLLKELSAGLTRKTKSQADVTKEAVIRRAERITRRVLLSTPLAEHLSQDQLRAILAAVRHRVDETAEAKPSQPPGIKVNPLSSEVKENASPAVVARLTLAMREEGLEWEISRSDDGTTRRRLGPE
jgi:hypothetical protein